MSIDLVLVEPTEKDGKLVMEWRNDPITLSQSFNSTPKVWQTFWPEFQREYFSKQAPPAVFGRINQVPFGFLRYRPLAPGMCDISINIAPDFRGKKLASPLLSQGNEHGREWGVAAILAQVKRGNLPSHRLFVKEGYQLEKEGEIFHYWLRFSPLLTREGVASAPPQKS